VTPGAWVLLALFLIVLLACVAPLGGFMADVYEGRRTFLSRVLGPVERLAYRLIGVSPETETDWRTYALGLLLFNACGCLFVYFLQRLQGSLPLNPQGLTAVSPDLAFNVALSFVTNTNWQSYGGETTLSYLVQMLGLTVQNFVSAASGMAVLIALVRGFARKTSPTIGSFWVDLVRSTLYILFPLSLLFAVFLVSQGVVQTFAPYVPMTFFEATKDADGKVVTSVVAALGPAASQIAIKDLGTNGGGFFNANSAHPFENPTPLTNFVIMVSILLIPAALCYTFGKLVKDKRQGWTLLVSMTVIFVPLAIACMALEQRGSPALSSLHLDSLAGNMEGKETRFGVAASALYAAVTTAASNGSVNAAHDSFTPMGGLIPMWLIQLGEVVFGGVGSGLYGLLMFAVIAVFVSGLMVGRTPEYLGKKIEAYEMKMASLVVLIPAAVVLVGTAIAVLAPDGVKGISNPGAHGFSEVLYGVSSAANNNGSAFGGLSANTPFYNVLLGVAMFIGPAGAGTLPTHTPLFVTMLVGVVVIVGALTFIPALALGPVVEELLAQR